MTMREEVSVSLVGEHRPQTMSAANGWFNFSEWFLATAILLSRRRTAGIEWCLDV